MSATLLRYKLAILYGFVFSVNAPACSATAAFAHVTFKELSVEDWVVIVLAVVGSWTTTLLAFLNKAMQTIPPEPPKQPNP